MVGEMLDSIVLRLVELARSAHLAAGIRLQRLILQVRRRRKPQALVPEGKPGSGAGSRLRVAAVLDKFSSACLGPECDLLSFGPGDFRAALDENPPDLLLVESAWNGNGGAWRRRLDSHLGNLGGELDELVGWCAGRGVPTVFWAKEDPVSFERFIRGAGLFGYVFTSDADCVPRYRDRLGHDRVFALPFAAQQAIHHPVSGEARTHPVCFAGSYWGDRYRQRQVAMENLLKPAMEFGLHIFDRNYGQRGLRAMRWRFPRALRPAVQGRLEYDQMADAYRRYRVFLNVNSVTDSPTMFPRRIFELLACGTPVISSYARGIEEVLGGDAVLFSSSQKETRDHLERLLGDDAYWARRSLLGIRRVMSAHTYTDRLAEICRRAGLNWTGRRESTFVAVTRAANAGEQKSFERIIDSQTRRPDAVVVLRDPDLADEPGRLLGELRSQADWLCVFRPGHHYGSHYLEDLTLATRYSDAEVMGKRTHFRTSGDGQPVLEDEGNEHRLVSGVPCATVMASTSVLSPQDLKILLESERFEPSSGACLSVDRFNYLHGPLPAGCRDVDA
jgi:hypothetical protein